jgi:hypothetical protein
LAWCAKQHAVPPPAPALSLSVSQSWAWLPEDKEAKLLWGWEATWNHKRFCHYTSFHLPVLGFELRALYWLSRSSTTWATPPALSTTPLPSFFSSLFFSTGAWTQDLYLEPLQQSFFCNRVFQDRVLRIICPGWLRTAILLISASRVARITGVSHWHPASKFLKS